MLRNGFFLCVERLGLNTKGGREEKWIIVARNRRQDAEKEKQTRAEKAGRT